MVSTSAHHVVRLTVRIDVASFHRDVDVTLPTSSSFNEILPELARLVDMPEVTRPWEATTVSGAVLDSARPLYQLRIHDGQVVVLRPREPLAPPIVRDAAEALAAAAGRLGPVPGLGAAASLVGAAMVFVLVDAIAGFYPALVSAAAGCVAVGSVARSRALCAAAVLVLAAAAGAWVAGPREEWTGSADPALGALAAAAVVGFGAVCGGATKLFDAPVTAFFATSACLIGLGAGFAWLGSPTAPPAGTALAGLAAVMASPGVATRAAGIAIPRVPTAGENFAVADDYQLDIDSRGVSARGISAGIAAAVCACCSPALLLIGISGGGWAYALCICFAAALVVHAFRHHATVPRACLAVTSLTALLSSALAVAHAGAVHPAWLALAFCVATVVLTATLWAARAPDLEPTTLVWVERAETAAIIAVIPLAFQLAGVFNIIRGL
ncbi:type VII secretion integral membrane protein EccD [Corynebacterium liangguodongii]|uniref:Type VII secretion integral membrane protein EccD n=1 Tax=Corynebacterium liangguodongii TaxID=2079535 RepID=A0A2S0WCB7_9CORY|nr:type VII secretion integral membrane protein EccD [Corynebacterium liangguodongii]AWB83406.1 type VII secretion integral membrane protein EccD [Corynebacterium liangguodongii]PWC00504.1 type VII secretion integral membrane protein EccD [Corynebacterium liangguodongii]